MRENFYLNFKNLPGEPYIALDTDFTIGSEAGDYIVKEHGVASKHCTFDIRKGVVSLIDHGSEHGTFIDGQRILSGKVFILMPGDRVQIGNHIETELVKTDYKHSTTHLDHWSSPPSQEPINLEVHKKNNVDVRIDEDHSNEREINFKNNDQAQALSPKIELEEKKKKVIRPVAGTISRLFSVLIDILLAVTFYNLLNPYLSFIKSISFFRLRILSPLLGSQRFIGKIIEEFAFVIDLASFIMIFMCVSSLVFGVTCGQSLIGITVEEESWFSKRLKGLLRTITGFITAPFLVFDLPALIPRRTFKEKITKSALVYKSNFLSVVKGLFLLVLMVLLCFFSPMFQGFNVQPSYDIVGSHLKVVERFNRSNEILSSRLQVSLLDHAGFIVFPYGEKSTDEHIVIHPLKHDTDSESAGAGSVKLESIKNYNLLKSLKENSNVNPFFAQDFPAIQLFINNSNVDQSVFKKRQWSSSENLAFKKELLKLVEVSFNLQLQNVVQHVKAYGPFIKGYLDFKVRLLSSVGNFDEVKVRQIGDTHFLAFSTRNISESDILFPLYAREEIAVLKMSPAQLSNAEMVFGDVYKSFFKGSLWGKATSKNERFSRDEISGVEVHEFINLFKVNLVKINQDIHKKIYTFYFHLASRLLKLDDVNLKLNFSSSINQVVGMLSSNKSELPRPEQEITKELIINLKNIAINFQKENISFFGLIEKIDEVQETKEL